MFDHDSLIISYDEKRGDPRGSRRRSADPAELGLGSCIDCRKCVNVCPTGIDIRDGLQYQCIGCAACVDACEEVMSTMGYGESLVRYSSQNRDEGTPSHWLRPRLVGYASLIVVLMAAFATVVTSRIPIGLDIARDRNRLYRQSWDDSVENVYTLRVENRDAVEHTYRVEFESGMPLAYEGPRTVHVEAGKRASLPIRLVLSGDQSDREFTEEDVVFHVQSEAKPEIEIEKTSRFHRPPTGESK
jgi:cytochrome c oxidase accessory protein FixG